MPSSEGKVQVTRRDFLRNIGAGVAGAALLCSCKGASQASSSAPTRVAQAPAVQPAPAEKVRAAIIRHSGILADESTPDPDAVLAALDAGVRHCFGTDDAPAAWRRVAGPDDVVAIKVNCISGLIYSTPEVSGAIAQRLIEVGVPPEKIIIWDRDSGELQRSRYRINRDGPGVRCYGTDGAYGDWVRHRSISVRLSRIIDEATVIINVPVLKNHGGAGVTLSMKNHYGSVANPGDLHANLCNPACAHLADLPAIRDKTRLIVCDATRGLCDQGPGGTPDRLWPARSLIVSTNMVAADVLGLEMIEAERARRGLVTIAPHAIHIATAASIGLGPNDRAQMDVLELDLS